MKQYFTNTKFRHNIIFNFVMIKKNEESEEY